MMRRSARWLTLMVLLAMASVPQAAVAGTPPNILAIWGDDIGWFNLSIHNFGIMGYRTPNLDKLGKEWGGMFTDAYAEQSCTAGRAAFLTGQHGLRSGMIKVGLPGVDFGLHQDDATIAGILKHEYGYATAQFGKNHLGDTNEYLPTNRGFDEFFGNLYHLNAEEEPEHPDYPGEAELPGGGTFEDAFGPRGVIHSFAKSMGPGAPPSANHGIAESDDPKWGPTKGQEIYNTGALTRERMKTIDGAFAREAIRFMVEAQLDPDKAATPFFVWYAASRMHIWTHLKDTGATDSSVPAFDLKCYESEEIVSDFTDSVCNLGAASNYIAQGETGYGIHPDGMVEHDMYVGQLLDFIEDNGLKDNTIVMYTTDNGPESFSWPDGGVTPFRSEKATNWEGGYRVPLLVHWHGVINPGFVSNEIIALQDWFPTLVNAVGDAKNDVTNTDIATALATGTTIANPYGATNAKYKVRLDGYDFRAHFKCVGGNNPTCANTCSDSDPDERDASCKGPRKEFIYVNDDGVLVGIRYNDWKLVFHEQREESFHVWEEPFTALRFPKLMNLRSDPFEKADHDSSYYDDYRARRMFALAPAQVAVYRFLQTFQEFPPRQAPPSFTVDVDVNDIIEACGTVEDPNLNASTDCFPSEGEGAEDALSLGMPNLGFGG